MPFVVHTIPMFTDNYCYCIVDEETKDSLLVDPASPSDVLSALPKFGVDVSRVKISLTTHKHWDHAGGNIEIKKLIPGLQIYSSTIDGKEPVVAADVMLNDREIIKFGNLNITGYHAPCHTKGHILYYIESEIQKILCTGDCLFIGGCGKFFEGNGEDMLKNMDFISSLPKNTLIYPGHVGGFLKKDEY